MIQTEIKTNGLVFTLSAERDLNRSSWGPTYRNEIRVRRSIRDDRARTDIVDTIILPIEGELRHLISDRRYKYFKFKIYLATITSLSAVVSWQGLAFANVSRRYLNKFSRRHVSYDHGSWAIVIRAINKARFKELFKTNITVI